MKYCWLIGLLSVLSGIAGAQCATGNPGTNCNGPLTVQPQPGNTGQSAITLVDLGLPLPTPAVRQYTLSIASGIIPESDNGNSYHPLVGPVGPRGPQGATGPTGPQGTRVCKGSPAPRDQLDRREDRVHKASPAPPDRRVQPAPKAHRARAESRPLPRTIASIARRKRSRLSWEQANSEGPSTATRSTC